MNCIITVDSHSWSLFMGNIGEILGVSELDEKTKPKRSQNTFSLSLTIYLARYVPTKLKINQFHTQYFIMGRKRALSFADNFIYFYESGVNHPSPLPCPIFSP